jgi:hypothetical protein
MSGFFVAAMVVTLLQYLRIKERRMLPLLSLFAFSALGHFRGDWDVLGIVFFVCAGLSGLWLLWMLSPRHPQPRQRNDGVAQSDRPS